MEWNYLLRGWVIGLDGTCAGLFIHASGNGFWPGAVDTCLLTFLCPFLSLWMCDNLGLLPLHSHICTSCSKHLFCLNTQWHLFMLLCSFCISIHLCWRLTKFVVLLRRIATRFFFFHAFGEWSGAIFMNRNYITNTVSRLQELKLKTTYLSFRTLLVYCLL